MNIDMTGKYDAGKDDSKECCPLPVDEQEKLTSESITSEKEGNKPERKNTHPIYRSMDELPSVLGVKELHTFLGISRAGAYQLLHREDFPTLHIASRLLVPKDALKRWIEQNINGADKQSGY